MKTLEQELSQYGAYHLDKRNIASHFVGIPLILWAVVAVLSRPQWWLFGVPVSAALLAALFASVYYLRLNRILGFVMVVVLVVCLWSGAKIAAMETGIWLALSLGTFVLGWAVQFVGHVWERRKPAFVDDVIGLVIGPLFIAAEAMFFFGWRADLRLLVERNARSLRAFQTQQTSSEIALQKRTPY
jgi:uncharacterized membrane protein YGL010W